MVSKRQSFHMKLCRLDPEIPEVRSTLVARAIEGLLVGVLEGEGSGGAILPRLGAEVVVEAGAGGHGLGVEVGGEGAILHENKKLVSHLVMPHSFHTAIPSVSSKMSAES